jgi:hypothetical protein
MMDVIFAILMFLACFIPAGMITTGINQAKVTRLEDQIRQMENLISEYQTRFHRMKVAAQEARLGRRCMPCDERCPAYPCSAAKGTTSLKEGS